VTTNQTTPMQGSPHHSSELQEAAAAAIVVARSCAPGAWRGDDEAACCWCSLNAHLD